MRALYKTVISVVPMLLAVMPTGAQTGLINWSQINSAFRHGTQVYGQASDGTGVSGHCVKFNADGSTSDAGAPCGTGGGSTSIYTGAGSPNGAATQFSPGTMTDNTHPSPYVISSSGGSPVGNPWKSFSPLNDGQHPNGGCCSWAESEIQLDTGTGTSHILSQYQIVINYVPNSSSSPTGWTVYGSNDNSTWTSLDTRSGQSMTQNVLFTYTVTLGAACRYFRVGFSDIGIFGAQNEFGKIVFFFNSTAFTGGIAGDFYLDTTNTQWYGPRPSGGSPAWPLIARAESSLSITDILNNNVSTTAHGFAPKLPNDASRFFDGTGAYSSAVRLIASGTSALGAGAIASGACATAVTGTATGTLTSDNLLAEFNADVSAVTGYGVTTTGQLTVYKYLTANNVNFKVCNSTALSITPGAATLNWRVTR